MTVVSDIECFDCVHSNIFSSHILDTKRDSEGHDIETKDSPTLPQSLNTLHSYLFFSKKERENASISRLDSLNFLIFNQSVEECTTLYRFFTYFMYVHLLICVYHLRVLPRFQNGYKFLEKDY